MEYLNIVVSAVVTLLGFLMTLIVNIIRGRNKDIDRAKNEAERNSEFKNDLKYLREKSDEMCADLKDIKNKVNEHEIRLTKLDGRVERLEEKISKRKVG